MVVGGDVSVDSGEAFAALIDRVSAHLGGGLFWDAFVSFTRRIQSLLAVIMDSAP